MHTIAVQVPDIVFLVKFTLTVLSLVGLPYALVILWAWLTNNRTED